MNLAVRRLEGLSKEMLEPFFDEWHDEIDFNRALDKTDCDELKTFYSQLESVLSELNSEMLKSTSRASTYDGDLASIMLAQTTPLFTWQSACPICFDVGDSDILEYLTRRGDSCREYLFRLSRASRHLLASKHWDDDSESRLEMEFDRIYSSSLEYEKRTAAALSKFRLYDVLPFISQSNLLFGPDEVNYQMFYEGREETDCLGRTGLHQALDAIGNYSLAKLEGLAVTSPRGFDYGAELINAQDLLGRTLLHVACQKGWTEGVRDLMKYAPDPSLKTDYGSLPLHYAAAIGSLEICQLVQPSDQYQYNINEVDSQGNTALYYAVGSGNAELVEFLLTQPHKVDPNIAGKFSPVWKAFHMHHEEMVRLLIEGGADFEYLLRNRKFGPETPLRLRQLVTETNKPPKRSGIWVDPYDGLPVNLTGQIPTTQPQTVQLPHLPPSMSQTPFPLQPSASDPEAFGTQPIASDVHRQSYTGQWYDASGRAHSWMSPPT